MTDPEAPWEPRPAYPQLLATACEMRPDWSPTELRDAMTAAHQAGWPWVSVFREVARLALARDETPATLRNSSRRPGARGQAGPPDPAAIAALKAGDYARAWTATHDGAVPPQRIRATGPQAVLAENDSQGDAA